MARDRRTKVQLVEELRHAIIREGATLSIKDGLEKGFEKSLTELRQENGRLTRKAENAQRICSKAQFDLQKAKEQLIGFSRPRQAGNTDEFMECDYCANQSGTPTLCSACTHNRTLISKLQKKLETRLTQEIKTTIKKERARLADLYRPVQWLLFALKQQTEQVSLEADAIGKAMYK